MVVEGTGSLTTVAGMDSLLLISCSHGELTCFHGDLACYHGELACFHGDLVCFHGDLVCSSMVLSLYCPLSVTVHLCSTSILQLFSLNHSTPSPPSLTTSILALGSCGSWVSLLSTPSKAVRGTPSFHDSTKCSGGPSFCLLSASYLMNVSISWDFYTLGTIFAG